MRKEADQGEEQDPLTPLVPGPGRQDKSQLRLSYHPCFILRHRGVSPLPPSTALLFAQMRILKLV